MVFFVLLETHSSQTTSATTISNPGPSLPYLSPNVPEHLSTSSSIGLLEVSTQGGMIRGNPRVIVRARHWCRNRLKNLAALVYERTAAYSTAPRIGAAEGAEGLSCDCSSKQMHAFVLRSHRLLRTVQTDKGVWVQGASECCTVRLATVIDTADAALCLPNVLKSLRSVGPSKGLREALAIRGTVGSVFRFSAIPAISLSPSSKEAAAPSRPKAHSIRISAALLRLECVREIAVGCTVT